jgi:hypothetical protein
MHEDFEMIQHFACQIIKAALNRNLVDADHYHAKMDRKIEEMWNRTGQDRNNRPASQTEAAIRELATRITGDIVAYGYIPEAEETDTDTEVHVQEIITQHLTK